MRQLELLSISHECRRPDTASARPATRPCVGRDTLLAARLLWEMGCCGSRGDSHGSSGGGGGSDGGSGYGQVGADRQPQPKWHGALGPVLFHASLPVLATGALPAFHGTVTCLMMLLCSAGLGLVVAEWRGEPTANLYHFDSLLVVLDRYQRRCGIGMFWRRARRVGGRGDHWCQGSLCPWTVNPSKVNSPP